MEETEMGEILNLLKSLVERTEQGQKRLEDAVDRGQRETRSSLQYLERETNELKITATRQQGILDEHIRRTAALENLVNEVRHESKQSLKLLREDMERQDKAIITQLEEKLKPSTDAANSVFGFWRVIKFIGGGLILVAGSGAAFVAILKWLAA